MLELYKNVIEPFIADVITEGETYVDQDSSWKSRDDYRPEGDTGMSYCYGCKDTIEYFEGA